MARARVTSLALLALLALTATVAVAQHRNRHRHRHGNGGAVDAGVAATEVDAGTARASAPARGGGRPTQADAGSCTPGVHIVSMRSPPTSAARPCTEDADCGLAQITCCAPCGEAGERDVVAVQVTAVSAWNEALCDGETTCPRCRSQMSHTLTAVCLHGLCEVRVSEDCGGTAPIAGPTRVPVNAATGASRWTHTSDWNDSAPETSE